MTSNETIAVNPYVYYGGRCEEAIEFYTKILNAELVMKMRFGEHPEPIPSELKQMSPSELNKIMHAHLRIGGSTLMMSDGCPEPSAKLQGFSLVLEVAAVSDIEKLFSALSRGGAVVYPLGKTFFSPKFGRCKDRFGVPWTLIVAAS